MCRADWEGTGTMQSDGARVTGHRVRMCEANIILIAAVQMN